MNRLALIAALAVVPLSAGHADAARFRRGEGNRRGGDQHRERPPREAGAPAVAHAPPGNRFRVKLGRQAPRVRRVGDGAVARPTIVYLHGLGGAPVDGLGERLATALEQRGENFEMVSPWMRPAHFDEKGRLVSDGDHLMTDQLDRAREIIDAIEGPVILMGHSFGGKAALVLAEQLGPQKVAGVVGLAPSVKMLYAYWKDLTGERGMPGAAQVRDRLGVHQRWLEGELAKSDPSSDRAGYLRGQLGYLRVMQDLAGHDEGAVEGRVQRPTLVLHGTHDGAVSIHYIRRFAAENASANLVELDGMDHGFVAHLPGEPGRPRPVDVDRTRAATGRMADEIQRFLNQIAPAR